MSAFPTLLMLAGAALGPHGLALLTPQVLSLLDPAAPVGLVVLGIVATANLKTGRHDGRVVRMAIQACITAVVVGGGLLVARPPEPTIALFAPWTMAAAILGIAAATSDVEDAIVPIVAGALLLAWIREPAAARAANFAAQFAGIALLVAGAGWLLQARAHTTDEQRVSTFASVLLLGGAADYLSMSALLAGALAAACWRLASPAVREHIRRDVAYVTDSLLALVLILAGAHADYAPVALAVAVGYTVLRVVGKLAGRWVAHHLGATPALPPTRLLLAPGAIGVAFALNVVRALGSEYASVLTVVVVGTIASSIIATLAQHEVNA